MKFRSEIIKNLRKSVGMTQAELSEKLKLSLDMVKKMESGNKQASVETLEKLSGLFSVSVDYLLGREVAQNENEEILKWKQRAMKAERRIDELTEIVDYFTKTFNDIPKLAKVMIRAQVLLEEE